MAKTILITGCSSGIGEASARMLREKGWRVFATCRREEDAERLKSEGFESWRLDYADEENVAAGAAEALSRSGGNSMRSSIMVHGRCLVRRKICRVRGCGRFSRRISSARINSPQQ